MNLNECCSILTDIDIIYCILHHTAAPIERSNNATAGGAIFFEETSSKNNMFLIQHLPVLKLRSIKGLSLEIDK
jgi:hypothetical protein